MKNRHQIESSVPSLNLGVLEQEPHRPLDDLVRTRTSPISGSTVKFPRIFQQSITYDIK